MNQEVNEQSYESSKNEFEQSQITLEQLKRMNKKKVKNYVPSTNFISIDATEEQWIYNQLNP